MSTQQEVPPSASATTPPSLESLPFEIQEEVLTQLPNLQSLSALIHASPRLHSVYLKDRLQILSKYLEQVLESVLVDAHATYLSGREEFQRNRNEDRIWEFIDTYQAQRSVSISSSLVQKLSLQEVTEMVRFHLSVIEPLTELYTTWSLAALHPPPPQKPGQIGMEANAITKVERTRIYRALYRLQLFCNLCGTRGDDRDSTLLIAGDVDRARILAIFQPWEVEEILCINEFAQDKYSRVLDQVAWDLDEERNPRYAHISITSVNEALQVGNPDNLSYITARVALLKHGLPLLTSVFKTTDHEELVSIIRDRITFGVYGDISNGNLRENWLDEAVSLWTTSERRENWYSEKDAAQDSRQRMTFDGDSVDSPPLAWVILWRDTYSNLFGWCIPNTFRRWGYVIWDAHRLDSGAKDYLRVDWEERHRSFGEIQDPRDEFEDPR